MNLWGMMVVAGAGTFLIRLSFILLVGEREIPAFWRQTLRFVPPAVLSAIILPELLIQNGQIDISLGNSRLLAGLLAAGVAWKTRSATWTIIIGMAALWLLERVL